MRDSINNDRPFFKQMHPCGRCSRDVEIQEAFFHWANHHKDLVSHAHYEPDACSLCDAELPDGTNKSAEGWLDRFRHFREEHGIVVVQVEETTANDE